MKKHMFVFSIPKYIVLKIIRVYQRLLSPDHSFWAKKKNPHGFCQFFPTCSEYGYQAIEKYGVVRGGGKAVWRILRCNPWSKGGIDNVN